MNSSISTETGWDFLVDRGDLRRRTVRLADIPADLTAGEVLIRVDAFALTANNLTYAMTGDQFGYWRLFPAEDEWGRVPAWGYGTVERSSCPDVSVGERFAGMVPMSSHLVMLPRLTRDGVVDLAGHRSDVNPVYNRYTRVTGRVESDLERDAALRPVYILSFVPAHHLRASGWFGATRVIVTSASSKASLGLAHALSSDTVSVIGLTSPAHREVVLAAGLFDDVVTYDRITELSAGPPSVLVDVTGNSAGRDDIRDQLHGSLVDTVLVGQTDWDQPHDQMLGSTDGAAPFFAPTTIQRLVHDWGPAEFATRLDTDLQRFTALTDDWLHPDHRDGREAMPGAFDDVAAGDIPPDRFVIVRPHGHSPATTPGRPSSS